MRNNSDLARKDALMLRRELIAQLRLRGLTIREIARALAERGIEISYVTVKRDLDILRELWRAEAIKDVSEHTARQLAELEQVRRKAWADNDLNTVLRALELEMRLLGTAAPDRVEMTAAVVGAIKLYAVENSPDVWDAQTAVVESVDIDTSGQTG